MDEEHYLEVVEKGSDKRGWGATEGKSLVFGIYRRRNGKVITFPVSNRRQETLIPLIRQHTGKGSLYYSNDHTAYAALNLIGQHQVIALTVERNMSDKTRAYQWHRRILLELC